MLTFDIQEKVRNMSDLDKIHLIEMLMDDLDIPDPDVEKLWIEESERRYKAYKEGKVKGIPLEAIKERYSKLRKSFMDILVEKLNDRLNT